MHGVVYWTESMKLARPGPDPPRKGRPAALGESPSRIAQRYERGKAPKATQGVFHLSSAVSGVSNRLMAL